MASTWSTTSTPTTCSAPARLRSTGAPQDGVTVHRLRSPVGRLSPLATHQTGLPLFKSRLRRLLAENRHDVIHFHNASLIGPGAFAWGTGVKLYTIHEQWLVCPLHLLWRTTSGFATTAGVSHAACVPAGHRNCGGRPGGSNAS